MRAATSAAAGDSSQRRLRVVVLIAFVFLLGLRLTLLWRYGAALPYSDQWDSEGWDLLRPYRLGLGIDWRMIIAAHNEHRIVFARLEALGLFALNDGQWDNQVAAALNAILVAGLAALALRTLLRQPLRDRQALAALLFVACCLPCGYENLMIGFQLQLYLLLALAVFGAWLVASRPPGPRLALQCALVAGLSLFTVASGLLTGAAMLCGLLLRRWSDRDAWRPYLAPMLVCAGAGAAGVSLLVPVPGHAAMHAHGLHAWLDAVCILGSWPLPAHWLCFAAIWAPTLLAISVLPRRRERRATDIAALVLALWTALQIASLAYARARELAPIASRYTDVLVVGVLVNAYFCTRLWRARHAPDRSRARTAWVAGWLVVVLGAYALRGAVATYAMHEFGASRAHQTANVRAYLQTRNMAGLERAEAWNVPYPDVRRLQRMLDDATITGMLPADVRNALALGAFHDGFERPLANASAIPGAAARMIVAPQQVPGLRSRMSYLRFPVVAGAGHGELDLQLSSADGSQSRRVVRADTARTPRDVYLRVPGKEFSLIVAQAQPPGAFALGAPVEMGRLSRATGWLLGTGPYMMFAALASAVFVSRRLAWRTVARALRDGDASAEDRREAA